MLKLKPITMIIKVYLTTRKFVTGDGEHDVTFWPARYCCFVGFVLFGVQISPHMNVI